MWEGVGLPQMTVVRDGDDQVGEERACAQSLEVHDLLAAVLPGSGSQAPGRLQKILYYSALVSFRAVVCKEAWC